MLLTLQCLRICFIPTPRDFVDLISRLSVLSDHLVREAEKNPARPLTDQEREKLAVSFAAQRLVVDLELASAAMQIHRITENLKRPKYAVAQARDEFREFRTRIEDELRARHFVFVNNTGRLYYQGPELFGPEVAAKFPAAADDIEDAGKSLALGLGTSCVMHLMRVMEVGLKALAQGLRIPYAPSWESYLNQIQSKIAAKPKTKGVTWKKHEHFYRDISGDLIVVKQAWRNPTMHIDRRYTPQEAEQVFGAVRGLMQRLAKGPP